MASPSLNRRSQAELGDSDSESERVVGDERRLPGRRLAVRPGPSVASLGSSCCRLRHLVHRLPRYSSETKSTDRKLTLLHYIVNVVQSRYADITTFYNELRYIEKAAAVSLENVLQDIREQQRGMDLTKREYSMHDGNAFLRDFLATSEARLERLLADTKTAQEAFNIVLQYFGENAKTTPPSVFFPLLVRFVKAYKTCVTSPTAVPMQFGAVFGAITTSRVVGGQTVPRSSCETTTVIGNRRHDKAGAEFICEHLLPVLKMNPSAHICRKLVIATTRLVCIFCGMSL
uniref:formin-like protein 2 n=1 Tax=Myxine glutinosa TaxID=7769 RepID=UPI00358DF25A